MISLFKILTKRQIKFLYLIIFLIICSSALDILGIGIVVPILTIITSDNLDEISFLKDIIIFLNYPSQEELIIYSMGLMIFVFTIKSFFVTVLNYIQSKYVWSIVADLSRRVFNSYLFRSYSFHLDSNSSKLISNTHNEVNQVANGIVGNLIHLITDFILATGMIILLIYIQPAGILFVAPLLIIFIYLFLSITKKYVKKWGDARQQFDQIRMKHLNQGLQGIKEVKIHGKEDYFANQYSNRTKQYSDMRALENFIQKAPSTFIEFIGAVGVSALIVFLIFTGNSPNEIIVTVGVFAAASFRLMPSVNRVASVIGGIRFSLAALDTLKKILNEEYPLIKNRDNIHKEKFIFEKIQLEKIYFNYESSKTKVLKDINIKILRNQSIGIMGPSGSGKSTLVDLFLGLLKPSNGEINVDTKNINDFKRIWQSKIGYVPQDIYMLDDTIIKNIAFGVAEDKIDYLRVKEVLKMAQLNEFINNLPNRYETIIGERGARISGGQRQRIGIARALYYDPDIIIFDEATSSLDQITEDKLMEDINRLHGTKTIIIISHRYSTVSNCDYIYVLKNGNIEKMYNNENFNKMLLES